MTELEIKKFARNKTIKATAILVTILIVLLLFGETRGDFANGILFFMGAIANIHTLIILTILFCLTYFFAGLAGPEIIIKRKNILLTSLKYVILISLTISIYAMIIAFYRQHDFTNSGFKNAMSLYFLPLFFKADFSLLLVWLWATGDLNISLAL